MCPFDWILSVKQVPSRGLLTSAVATSAARSLSGPLWGSNVCGTHMPAAASSQASIRGVHRVLAPQLSISEHAQEANTAAVSR